VSSIPASLRALLTDLIDYAGLFPPSALSMKTAVENYARYLAGPDAWALARFVLPVARFAEFEAAMGSIQPVEPWGISALLGASPEADLAEIDQFNHRNRGRAAVDTVEVKAATSEEISRIRAYVRSSIASYFEIPPEQASKLLPTIKAIHSRAKIRTGGMTADAIPPSESVARFIMQCAKYGVAFKATAGLHHPMRCKKPLTYEPNAPDGVMHGFLNVFLVAGAAWAGGKTFQCDDPFLRDGHPMKTPYEFRTGEGNEGFFTHWLQRISPFVFEDYGVTDPLHLPTGVIKSARQNFAISFGSCSFEEPFADLRELKLL
jgi:hypothetical protein